MNRYVIDGILKDADNGKRVLVLSENQAHSRHSFTEFVRTDDERITRTIRANGKESLETEGGGRIVFLSKRSNARGFAFDVIYADTELNYDQFLEFRMTLCSSPHGELIRF
jgi:hypothetical protein